MRIEILFIIFVILHILDIISSFILFDMNIAIEGNPVVMFLYRKMGNFLFALVMIKLWCFLCFYLVYKLNVRLCKILLMINIMVMMITDINNVLLFI